MKVMTLKYASNLQIIYFVRANITWQDVAEMSKSIVKGIGIGFLSCIGIAIGIAKTISQVLVLVLVLLRGHPKYWYWYC